MTQRPHTRIPIKAASFALMALAIYFFLTVLGSGCGGSGGFLTVKVTPTGSATPSSTPTATPGPLSGEVIIIGGMNAAGQVVDAAELFNPNTGAFATSGSMVTGRAFHTSTLLSNGQILVAGGQTSDGTALKSAELFSQTTQTFTATTGAMKTARALATATLLNNGQVLITGGVDTNGNPLASAELYNPSTQAFTAVSNMSFARAAHTATLLSDGTVLIAGGYSNSAQTTIVQPAEIYHPATKTFTVAANMLNPRYYHTATIFPSGSLLAGEVLMAGGVTVAGVSASSEVYKPSTTSFLAGPTMHSTHAQFTATLLQTGLVLVNGGETLTGAITAVAELYNPGSLFSVTGAMTSTRRYHTATIFNTGVDAGMVLVTGGESGTLVSTALATAEIYNPTTSIFTAASSMANSRFGHSANLFP